MSEMAYIDVDKDENGSIIAARKGEKERNIF
jgi:hypothetical protein